MAKPLETVREWRANQTFVQISASGFNSVLAAARANRRSLVANGFMDSSGTHSRQRPRDPLTAFFWNARIGTSVQDGANFRWTYQVAEVEKTGAGYGGWTDLADGRGGDAFNQAEDQNGASGLMGNGVDTANLLGTFALQPIPPGTRVLIQTTTLTDGSEEFWVVGMPNGVDGECPT